MNGYLRNIAGKKDREEKDITPQLMALGLQLESINKGIANLCSMEKETPEPAEKPEYISGFKIVRDEIGQIDKVIPEYGGNK